MSSEADWRVQRLADGRLCEFVDLIPVSLGPELITAEVVVMIDGALHTELVTIRRPDLPT